MRTIFATAAAAVLFAAPLHAAPATVGAVQTYSGICEPSGAVAFPAGSFGETFIVANDESNKLLAYSAAQGGASLEMSGGDLNAALEPTPEDEVDFEGATWLGGRIHWIGSHSRGNNGKQRPERWQFFSMEVAVQDGAPTLRLDPDRSSHDLLPAFAALDELLKKAIKIEDDDDNDLAPDKEGFNIEALTAAADERSMLIGLRNPLKGGNAFVVPFENPQDVLASGAAPALGQPIALALGDRGVRSMDYSAGAGAYFIMAGSRNAAANRFELFRWSGAGGEPPVAVEGSADALASLSNFTPEAMIVDADGKQVLLLSDDGDHCVEGQPEFRSVVMTIE